MAGKGWTDEHRENVAAAKAATQAAMPYRCPGCGQRRAGWAAMREHQNGCMQFRQDQARKREAVS